MEFPAVVLDELVKYLAVEDLKEMRLVDKFWEAIASPVLFREVEYSAPAKDMQRAFMQYGGHTRVVRVGRKHDGPLELTALASLFPRTLSVDAKLTCEENTRQFVLGCSGLNHLQHLTLDWDINNGLITQLQPIIMGLTSLTLKSSVPFGQNLLLQQIECPGLRKLTLLECRVRQSLLDTIEAKFPRLELLQIFPSATPDVSLLTYDLTRRVLLAASASNRDEFFDAALHFKPSKQQHSISQQYLDFLTIIDSNPFFIENHLPPINVFSLTSYSLFPSPNILKGLTTVDYLIVHLPNCNDIVLPDLKYAARGLIFETDSSLPSNFLPWIATNFPNLQILCTNQPITFTHSLPKLSHLLTPTISSLETLLKSAPKLTKISTSHHLPSQCPHLIHHVADYPSIRENIKNLFEGH
ncbi:hypothetical protein DSO57_1023490 [Entomophthora muscae]|uniref:Uncharacterized protein n=1 Tax=Entomophthora muscae TaxID=34485 RepID=A0ACC2T313_9FUNG|nr:hypothetical protein DSO57_1023490 [Entomophthora muscae]